MDNHDFRNPRRGALRGGRRLADTYAPGLVMHYESDDRFTWPALVRAIEESFGRIELDPCWHEGSAVRPVSHFDVRKGQDGLRSPWFGAFAFVNPPWSAQDEWLRHAHGEWASGSVGKVLFLVPAAVGAAFFHDVLASDADIFFLRGRPRFSKVDGTSEGTMVNTMLVALGSTADDRRRLAARVRGSWWSREQLSAAPVGAAWRGRAGVSWLHGPVSCAAGRTRVVVCGPQVASTPF